MVLLHTLISRDVQTAQPFSSLALSCPRRQQPSNDLKLMLSSALQHLILNNTESSTDNGPSYVDDATGPF